MGNRTLKIPTEKLHEIQDICKKFTSKTKVTKNQLQSLLDSLLYTPKCVKPARFFLNRMLQLLRDHTSKSVIQLSHNFHRDLNWFNTFLVQYNGVTFFDYKKPDHTIYLDTCLTGYAAVFANKIYALPIPLGYKGPRWQSGNTLASHLCSRGSIPVMAVSGKAGSCLPLVGSLQYRTLANYMYWFPLPFQLPVVI